MFILDVYISLLVIHFSAGRKGENLLHYNKYQNNAQWEKKSQVEKRPLLKLNSA